MNGPTALAREIIAEQQAKGLKKYGVPVADAEGQDWLRHAAEEAADLLVYLCAEIAHRDTPDLPVPSRWMKPEDFEEGQLGTGWICDRGHRRDAYLIPCVPRCPATRPEGPPPPPHTKDTP